jgi:predicted small lipoprotein YifL
VINAAYVVGKMMYNYFKQLILLTALSATLAACGGASTESAPPSNKPEVPASSTTSMSESSTSEATTTNSSASSTAPIQSGASSAAQSYVRTSQQNQASSTPKSGTANTKLTAPELTNHTITLAWDEPIDKLGVAFYKIERNGVFIADVAHPSNTYKDINLNLGTDYSYTIQTYNLAGEPSEKSAAIVVRTLGGVVSNSSNANSSNNSANSNSSAANSNSSAANSNSSNSSSGATTAVSITWAHPNKRENGDYLELDEIGGYEIRYRNLTDNHYSYITINGNKTKSYNLSGNLDNVEFEIAVFDNKGLYSRFVKVIHE